MCNFIKSSQKFGKSSSFFSCKNVKQAFFLSNIPELTYFPEKLPEVSLFPEKPDSHENLVYSPETGLHRTVIPCNC